MTPTFQSFTSGLIAAGMFVAALFFVRFWHRTRDRLFVFFALAFVLLGMGHTIIVMANIPVEERSPLYLVRLTAFLLILFGIWQKNRSSGEL